MEKKDHSKKCLRNTTVIFYPVSFATHPLLNEMRKPVSVKKQLYPISSCVSKILVKKLNPKKRRKKAKKKKVTHVDTYSKVFSSFCVNFFIRHVYQTDVFLITRTISFFCIKFRVWEGSLVAHVRQGATTFGEEESRKKSSLTYKIYNLHAPKK